jgi:hypothetical protein
LKKRLYDENSKKGRKWINEISLVVWRLWTQPSKATGQSPFFLVYGPEAILPADVMWKSPRLEMFEEGEADTARHLELDSVEKIRCNVLFQSARYLQVVRLECSTTLFQYWRYGSSTNLGWYRATQA